MSQDYSDPAHPDRIRGQSVGLILGAIGGTGLTLAAVFGFFWFLMQIPAGESDVDILYCQACCEENGYKASDIRGFEQCHCLKAPGDRAYLKDECPL